MKHFGQNVAIVIAVLSAAGCASTSVKPTPKLTLSGPTMTIDEDMYDAAALAQKVCEGTGYVGAVLISRDAAEKKSTYQCGR